MAGVVRTLDGKAHEGEVRLSRDGLEIRLARGGEVAKVPLADVLQVDQRPGAKLDRADVAVEVKKEQAGQNRWRDVSNWQTCDVGQARPPGRVSVRQGVVQIEAGGEEIGGPAEGQRGDQFFFVHRPLKGDGEIIARVAELRIEQKAPRAGVMFRDGLDRDGAHVMLSLTGSKTYFQARPEPRAATRREPCGDARPKWMKVSRAGNRFTAWVSDDGTDWQKIGEQTVSMGQEALAGLAVASRKEGAAEVTFEGVEATAGGEAAEAPSTGSEKPWVEKVVERGIVFRDGSVVAAEVRSADGTSVHYVRRGGSQEQSAPLGDVAKILVRKAKRNVEAEALESGVVLAGGDFVAGELKSMKDGQLTVSSVLFGLRRLDLNRDVATVALRAAAAGRAAFEIETRDGSLFLARSVAAAGNELVAHTEVTGEVKLAWADVEELRAGAGRLAWLSELDVAKASGPGGVADASHYAINFMPAGGAIELAGKRYGRGVGMAAGVMLEWELDGRYSVLVGEVGVPSGILPAGGVVFVVAGDDKELWRSASRTSVDGPEEITVTVKGVKRLALRLEAASDAKLAATGAWANAALVKAP